jgi:hypothetical protein
VGTWFGLNGLTVTFAKDGTFTQTGLKRFTGRWKNEEDHIAVEIEKIDGKPIDEGVRALAQTKGSKSSKLDVARIDRLFSHIVFAVGEDGKTITQKVSGMQPVTYTRSPQ